MNQTRHSTFDISNLHEDWDQQCSGRWAASYHPKSQRRIVPNRKFSERKGKAIQQWTWWRAKHKYQITLHNFSSVVKREVKESKTGPWIVDTFNSSGKQKLIIFSFPLDSCSHEVKRMSTICRIKERPLSRWPSSRECNFTTHSPAEARLDTFSTVDWWIWWCKFPELCILKLLQEIRSEKSIYFDRRLISLIFWVRGKWAAKRSEDDYVNAWKMQE